MRHLPNILTISRLALLPVLLGLLMQGTSGAVWAALALYIIGAATDYIDGWVARRYGLHSKMGQMLDPIADKIFVTAVILMLIAFGRIEGWWIFAPILILAREFLVSGLREYLGPKNITMPVTRLAKWKTGLQMVALGFLLAGPVGEAVFPATQEVGYGLLLIATFLTLVTGWHYLREGLKHVD
jgi:cardiolipin synthase (CMP-forming)